MSICLVGFSEHRYLPPEYLPTLVTLLLPHYSVHEGSGPDPERRADLPDAVMTGSRGLVLPHAAGGYYLKVWYNATAYLTPAARTVPGVTQPIWLTLETCSNESFILLHMQM